MLALDALRRARALPFLVAVATAVLLSLVAYAGRVPPELAAHGIDKILHASMAATLTVLLARALGGRAALAALLVLVPLAIDEYLQRYSASRSSDWGDLAADVLGALLAAAVYRRFFGSRAAASVGRPSSVVGLEAASPWSTKRSSRLSSGTSSSTRTS